MKKFRLLKITLGILTSVAAGGYYVLAPALSDIQISARQVEREARDKLDPSLKRLVDHRLDAFINRGRPRRILRDDGSNYLVDSRVTPSKGTYVNQLKKLDELERKQLGEDRNFTGGIEGPSSGRGGGGGRRRR